MRKKFNHLIGCLTICIFTSCSSMTRPLHYGVGIENKGKEMIVVDSFQITDGPVSIVSVGEAYPGGTVGMSPFYTKPFQDLTITWRVPATGARGQAQVQLDLPKEFTKERGSEIDFYIYPNKQHVEVAYDILNPKTGEIKTIQQTNSTRQP